ncbi:MAG: 50S ribosomal protein L10 [Acidobacteria bacterium]|nr:MAG: 50S ribosomal protein L10 [Acidobacteriota bacterium]PIE90130.1 MAG: 50S ribosomal protein L10 [Acidobacteriota bacterium]
MEKTKKAELLKRVKEDLEGVDSVFLCNFKGLTVEKDTELRRKVRESGSTYEVIKNRILKLAFEDSDFSSLDDHLKGNTALAYNKEDIVAIAKLISEFAKENDAFEFKAGVVQGNVIDQNDLQTLATLPSKEVLVSKLMYMLNFPIQGFATALNGMLRNVAVVLDQIAKQKEE